MTWEHIQTNWPEFRGKARERWAHLTDDDLDQAQGHKERVESKLQMRYGQTRDEARIEMDEFCRRCSLIT